MKLLSSVQKRRSIVTRLIVYIILFSSVVTLVTTSAQLYREYRWDLDAVTGAVENLRLSQLDILANSLWELDSRQIDLAVEGIARIPDIRRAEVIEQGEVTYFAGQEVKGASRSYAFPLLHRHDGRDFMLGELRIIVDLQSIYGRLFDRIWVILLSNAARTFAVSIFLFLVFQQLVTRHLSQIARYAHDLSPKNLDRPLQLKRRQTEGSPDEIDDLADSLNAMRENLRKSYDDLAESESRFRLLAEHIDAVFWIGGPDWRSIFYVSPAYEKVWGRPIVELYRSPLSWMQAVHPDDRPQVERTIAEASSDSERFTPQTASAARVDLPLYRVIRPDGSLRWISARAFPVADADGQLRYVVGIAEDVTKQVDSDLALRKAKEEAEEASGAKSQFLAHMSHELRTPLNAILGFSEILERQIFGPLQPAGYRDYATDIRKSGKHLLSLIDDILDLSRIEAGKVTLKLEPLKPGDLIAEALKLVETQAVEKQIEIENGLPQDLPEIRADRRGMLQVLVNVITNAVKFTPSGGTVCIGAEQRLDGGINLLVADSGRGIAPEEMEDLFKPFARSNVLLARSEEGTGLGLTICKQLMQLHGFDISVKSEVGKGTQVTLEFPKRAGARFAEATVAGRKVAG